MLSLSHQPLGQRSDRPIRLRVTFPAIVQKLTTFGIHARPCFRKHVRKPCEQQLSQERGNANLVFSLVQQPLFSTVQEHAGMLRTLHLVSFG